MVNKALFALVLLAFLGTARCYNIDFAAAFVVIPVVGAIVQPPEAVLDYVNAIGTPAPTDELPETDVSAWFPPDESGVPSESLEDWTSRAWLAAAETESGWAALCQEVGETVQGERAATNLNLAALGCSDDPQATSLQRFAVLVLRLQPEISMFKAGAPGSSSQAIGALLGEVRGECQAGYASRLLNSSAAVLASCTLPYDPLPEGSAAPFDQLYQAAIDAYSLLAQEIAARDPTIDESSAFGATTTATATP